MNDPISAEQAHKVAMQAALTAGAIAQTNYTHPDQVGKVISDAYLQAYEAVEGWTKPQTMEDLQRKSASLQRADYFTNQDASLQPKDA